MIRIVSFHGDTYLFRSSFISMTQSSSTVIRSVASSGSSCIASKSDRLSVTAFRRLAQGSDLVHGRYMLPRRSGVDHHDVVIAHSAVDGAIGALKHAKARCSLQPLGMGLLSIWVIRNCPQFIHQRVLFGLGYARQALLSGRPHQQGHVEIMPSDRPRGKSFQCGRVCPLPCLDRVTANRREGPESAGIRGQAI
jgi:hypothetical protein